MSIFRSERKRRGKRSEPARETAAPFDLADRHRDQGNWQEAAECYAAGLMSQPNNFAMLVQYGHALKESGRLVEAGEAYLRAERIDGENHDLPVHLGHLNKAMGNMAFADAYYRKAVAMGSRDRHALARAIDDESLELFEAIMDAKQDRSTYFQISETFTRQTSFAEKMIVASQSPEEGRGLP